MSKTLFDIADLLNVPVGANAARQITGVNSLSDASPSEISFISSEAHTHAFKDTRAAAVIVQKNLKLPENPNTISLLVDDAELAIAEVLELFAPPVPRPPLGVHPTAFVSPSASVATGARIGPGIFIGDNCRIGKNAFLHHNVYLASDVTLGDDCEFFPNVVIRERITIGHRVVIHAGSVLGTDGFGYRWDGTKHAKVPQIGTVIIEDDVEIGSCVCIDRAKFAATRIGRGTKIDNLVQIGHNVKVGPLSLIVAQVGISGSTELGMGVVLAGQVGVAGHVKIGDGARVGGQSGVFNDLEPGVTVSGTPTRPQRDYLRSMAALHQLPDLLKELRRLSQRVEELEKERT
jgi:UDP-3-O-[3-hydroxymyristoyl] glucosamine N-acyltransferase